MGFSDLFCAGRPAVDEHEPLLQSEAPQEYLDKQMDFKSPSLADDDDGEDEMQQRLSDLRKEISDAKVDW